MALIELKNIFRQFKMGTEIIQALNDVSLKIEKGEFVTVTGPSGCGKSTLMNLLGLLDSADQGSYSLDGKSVTTLNDDERSEHRNKLIGFVFQSFNLLPRMSALRNVEMPLVYSAAYDAAFSKTKCRRMAEEALDKVGLKDRMSHAPNELSGGQRQRVAIARALVNNPKIIFADEPTGNLDSKSGKDILKLFEDLHRSGVTLVIVTHDPMIAKVAPRTIGMLDGRVERDALQ